MNDQNQTKDSLFTEIKQEEAANVNGGSFASPAYWMSLIPSNFRLNRTINRNTVRNGDYRSFDGNLNAIVGNLNRYL